MAYRIEPGEQLGSAVRRIVAEQLRNAIDQLEGRGSPERDTAVHDARKSLKKSRSALRLIRFDLDAAQRHGENAVLRDAGRRLSGVRDADVLLKTLARVGEEGSETSPPQDAVDALRAALERHRDALVAQTHDGEGAATGAVRELRAAARRIDTWQLDEASRALGGGLRRIYTVGQDTMKAAFAEGADDEAWHDWRKRVKDLWYALRILEPVAPRVLGGMVTEASELSDILGDHNDLAVLDEAIDTHGASLATDEAAALHDAVRARRDELRLAARRPGSVLYAESPKAFARRVRAYWKSRGS